MAFNIQKIEGFVLHSRPFNDQKRLLSLFVESFGRVNAVYRIPKKQAPLAAFVRYEFFLTGASELKTIRSSDPLSACFLVEGQQLFCGMYLNELLMRALPQSQAFDHLLDNYAETVSKLSLAGDQQIQEILLRRLEFRLLDELGIGLNLAECADQVEIKADTSLYRFIPSLGFKRILDQSDLQTNCFSGAQLHAIKAERWDADVLRSAKILSRLALRPVLGDKPIKARELFT